MTAKAGWVTAMLHVASVEASIQFYELIGFRLIDTEGCGPLSWARLHCEDGSAIMLLRAEHDDRVGPVIEPEKQGVMLILYTADLPKLRAHLLANNVKAPEIAYPDFMPSGSLYLHDPDGYFVGVNHWSDKEHEAWLKQLEVKRAAGKLPTA
jgi:catechol-2,3-dioxygenase